MLRGDKSVRINNLGINVPETFFNGGNIIMDTVIEKKEKRYQYLLFFIALYSLYGFYIIKEMTRLKN